MRPLTAALMAAGVVALGLAVAVVGRNVAPGTGRQDTTVEREMFGPPFPADFGQGEARLGDRGDPARPVAPGTVAPPQVDTAGLVRAAPRDPLSPLGQALPPPLKLDDWGGTILYRPVATASARFEAKGYKVAIAGTESIDPAQTCTSGGVEWQCGIHARTAVRLWLRGRALSCQVPPGGRPRIHRRQLPPRQAGCGDLAGIERLGPRRRRRPLCSGRAEGARGEGWVYSARILPFSPF